MDTLSGAVERITYYNAENGYTALHLKPDTHLGTVSPTNLYSIRKGSLPLIVH